MARSVIDRTLPVIIAREDAHRSAASGGFEGERTYVPPEVSHHGRLELLVAGGETFVRYPLPDSGTLTIGRSDQADVRVDDPSISRTHVRLHVDTAELDGAVILHVEDLGSSNGTKVRGKILERGEICPITAGEVVDLGMTIMIVQRSSTIGRPRRLWTHGYFEVRLEEECERAQRSGANFAVVRVLVENGAPGARIEEVLTGSIRRFDLLASYAPGEYELLLVDSTEREAEQIVGSIRSMLSDHVGGARIGVACYPRDGRNPEALVAKAGAGVRDLPIMVPSEESDPSGIVIVEKSAMDHLLRLIDRVAPSDISVLILGETGVGKEVIAEAVHEGSLRKGAPFLRLNCAALPETLLESELFGYERGAFTGAVQAKPGLLETAEGGTVFLDEVGELPLSTQVKLLRVIEERQVLRVGGLKPRAIDVRFVSATNRDLEAEIAKGSYRKDLFYRLNGISLVIPPLRDRLDEIEPLARAFARKAAPRYGLSDEVRIAEDAFALLQSYYWPGNIRELRNVIERAVLLAAGSPIGPEHLPVEKLCASIVSAARTIPDVALPAPRQPSSTTSYMHLKSDIRDRVTMPSPEMIFPSDEATDRSMLLPRRSISTAIHSGMSAAAAARNANGDLKGELAEIERRRILEALDRCGGNQTQAARLLGMSRRTLVSRLDTYDIPRPRKGNLRD